jgi:hypothetical protein
MRVSFGFTIILLSFCLLSCGSLKKVPQTDIAKGISIADPQTDSIEYQLIVIDPGFSSWFETRRKPEWYYSLDYLESWNDRYVKAWNDNCRNRNFQRQHPDNPFDEEIDYQQGTNYGLDLNYRLYHYFLFIEDTWGKILPFDRRK